LLGGANPVFDWLYAFESNLNGFWQFGASIGNKFLSTNISNCDQFLTKDSSVV